MMFSQSWEELSLVNIFKRFSV